MDRWVKEEEKTGRTDRGENTHKARRGEEQRGGEERGVEVRKRGGEERRRGERNCGGEEKSSCFYGSLYTIVAKH